jgi:hypothetical protein
MPAPCFVLQLSIAAGLAQPLAIVILSGVPFCSIALRTKRRSALRQFPAVAAWLHRIADIPGWQAPTTCSRSSARGATFEPHRVIRFRVEAIRFSSAQKFAERNVHRRELLSVLAWLDRPR